jgi:DNA-binding response OmpR family regulator
MTTVLLVDRDPDTCTILASLLRHHGVDVAAESNPDRALEQACAATPRLIIVDHPLHLASGTPFIAALRARPQTAPCQVLVFTARFTPGMAGLDALAEGADAFLPKPADVATLRARLASLLDLPLFPPPAS